MKARVGIDHINMASRLMAMFMAAIWRQADLATRGKPLGEPKHSRGANLPKGFRNHNPAGTKIAQLAASQAIGMRGRVRLN